MKTYINIFFQFTLRCMVWRSDFETEAVKMCGWRGQAIMERWEKLFFTYL